MKSTSRESFDEISFTGGAIVPLELRGRERRWARDFWTALMLANDGETLLALLDGEKVPLERVDPVWDERLRRRS